MSNHDEIGARIKNARKSKGLTQSALAKLCGWDRQGRISNYENGIRIPSTKNMEKLAKALETSAAFLEYGDEKTVVIERSGDGKPGELTDEQADALHDVAKFVHWHLRQDDIELSPTQLTQILAYGIDSVAKTGELDKSGIRRMIRTYANA